MTIRWLKRILTIGLIACASAGLADVSVEFPVTDTTLRNLFTLTFDFTVDGSGNVTLDATTSNGGAAPQAVVNAWDGAAGTITNAAFFGTNFTLTAVARVNGFDSNFLRTWADGGQGLFVDSSPRIDNAGAEEIVWTYDGPGELVFKSVTYTNRAVNGDSNFTFLDSDTRTEYPLPATSTGGNIDLVDEGFSVVAGQSFIVTTDDFRDDGTTPRSSVAGAALYGLNIDLQEAAAGPATPANLSAVGSDSLVVLDWNDDISGELDFYTVYRGTVSGTNNYTAVTNVNGSAYNDTDVTNGTTYYYSVTATYTNGAESGFSLEASATPFAVSSDVVLYQHLDATISASVVTDGSNEVTAWQDQSGKGNDAAAETGSIQDSAPRYPGASLSQSGLAGVDMRTNRSAIVLFDEIEARSIFDFTGDATGNSGLAILAAFKADSIVSGSRDLVIGNAANIQDFQIRYDNGPLNAFLDGQAFNSGYTVQPGDTIVVGIKYDSTTGETVFWNSANEVYVTNTLSIAGNLAADELRIGGSFNGSQYFDGMIGEVKVYTSTLSASEFDSQLEGLVNKWIGVPSFANWSSQFGEIGAETNDFDGDGLDNLYEYGLGGNPTNFTIAPATLPVFTKTESGFEYIFVQRNNDPSLVYAVQTTPDLVFTPFANAGYTISGTNVSAGGVFDTVTNTIPVTADKLFIRLQIEN